MSIKSPQKDITHNNSYLVKAMESKKISKLTWESLFNMK